MRLEDPSSPTHWSAILPGGTENTLAQLPLLDEARWLALTPTFFLGAVAIICLVLAFRRPGDRKTAPVVATMVCAVLAFGFSFPVMTNSTPRLVASWQSGDPARVQVDVMTVTVIGSQHGIRRGVDPDYGTDTLTFTTDGDDRYTATTRQGMAAGLRVRLACDPGKNICMGGQLGQTDSELADAFAAVYAGTSGTSAYQLDPGRYSPFESAN